MAKDEDYEPKHAKEKDWSYTWNAETNAGGSSTGCLLALPLALISFLRRTA